MIHSGVMASLFALRAVDRGSNPHHVKLKTIELLFAESLLCT